MKKALIAVAVLIVLGGGFLIIRSAGTSKTASPIDEPLPTEEVALPTISSDVTVEVTAASGNKSVSINIGNIPAGVESVEYELTYTTAQGLPRGVLGKIPVSGEKEIKRDDIVLGTCSSGKCVYDTGVTSVDLSLKFNEADGAKVFRKTFEL